MGSCLCKDEDNDDDKLLVTPVTPIKYRNQRYNYYYYNDYNNNNNDLYLSSDEEDYDNNKEEEYQSIRKYIK